MTTRKAARGLGRRDFLALAGATTLAGAHAAHATAAQRMRRQPEEILAEALRYRKVDSHNHGGVPEASAADVVESCDRLGIERTAISIPRGETPDEFRASNDKVLAALKEFPDRLIGQCFVNPHHQREALEELNRCLGEGFVGLGELYYQAKISDPIWFPLIERSIEANAPVLMHARADTGILREGVKSDAPPKTSIADDFVDVGKRYPEAVIIHAHIGGGGDWEYMCKTLRSSPSVLIDTSGSIADEGMIDFAKECLGVERMLFATDMNYETGVGKILAADLTESERRAIFWDNYNNLLRKRGLHAD